MQAKCWKMRKYALLMSGCGLLLQAGCNLDFGLLFLNQLSNLIFTGVTNLLLPR